MSERFAIAAQHLLPVAGPPLSAHDSPTGIVIVVEGERIVALGRREDVPVSPDTPVHERPGACILPGLVNVHTHLELTGLSSIVHETDFHAWIRSIVRAKRELTEADRLLSSMVGAAWLAASGVTTCGDTCDGVSAIVALSEIGMRGRVYVEGFALTEGEVAEGSRALRERVGRGLELAAGTRVSVGVSPHAPYSVCAGMYRSVLALAEKESLPIAVHLAESRAETAMLRSGEGAFADMYRRRGLPFAAYGMSPVAYADMLGVLETGPLVIHAVQLESGEHELLARHGVSVAHCPRSNAYFGHGRADLGALRAAGVNLSLGTDGAVSCPGLDLFEEARFARLVHGGEGGVSLTPKEMLEMMTLGGARALGLEDEIGTLAPGRRADLAIVDLPRPAAALYLDPVAALVDLASAASVCWTIVDGKTIWCDGEHTGLDVARLEAELSTQLERLTRADHES